MAVLRERIHTLETRVRTLAAAVRVYKTMLRVSGFSLEHTRLPEGVAKESVLRAVTRANKATASIRGWTLLSTESTAVFRVCQS